MSRRKQAVVRMLAKVVRVVYAPPNPSMSGIEPDRSELEARNLLQLLQHLANKDPDNKFGMYFVRLQLKLLKRLRNFKH